MSDQNPSGGGNVPATTSQNSVRNWLIIGLLALAAAIIFGLLYLFVIAPAVPNGSVGWYLFSFATGLTMIVMPCTLPLAFVIVPLSMGKGMMKGISMALAFGIGVAFTLSLYGIAAALLGGLALGALGADLETLKNWVYFIAGSFALVFALSEIGLLKVHMPTYSGAAPAFIQKRQEILKAFFLGAFLGNVGVGCPHPATPLILIEIATSGDVLYGWTMFLIHAIGRVLPLLLLAFLAILGVNGLNWLMARKEALERGTGWAMVFVAGFILTLGLFSHDWWVNSGIHSALESMTQESRFNTLINDTLGTNVAHVHGLETGAGLFGLPLGLGSWFLVFVWLLPIWWWYGKRKRQMMNSPSFKLVQLEAQMDRLERDRRQIESMMNVDELEATYDLKHAQEEIDALEKKRREEEAKIEYGETGTMKNPIARAYEDKLLKVQRNYLIVISVFLFLVFVHYLPTNFYLKSLSGADHHGAAGTTTAAPVLPNATPFDKNVAGLPSARGLQFVQLQNGDSYTITASYVQKQVGNRTLRMLAYNGSIPGPFIKVAQGSQVTINFVNNTDVDQTIHSHGLRVNNNFDGVPDSTQKAVKPGETFTYTLNFPDAGVAWYHPHTRDDYGQELGLYGNYLIAPQEADYWSPVNREVPLVIDDILVENDQIQNFYKEVVNHALLGRFGNEFLVNGSIDYLLDVEKGEVIRFFITNVSNARTYRLSMPGATMKVVGADLSRYELETYQDEIVISPAERLVVEAYFNREGRVRLQNRMQTKTVTIAEFNVNRTEIAHSYADEFNATRRDEELTNTFNVLRTYQNAAPDKRLRLTVATTGNIDHGGHAHGMTRPGMGMGTIDGIEWGESPASDALNTTQNVEWMIIDEATGKKSMNIPVSDWTFRQGQLVKIRITSDHMAAHLMQHPIHLHGQRFVVLSENGVPNKNMVWKDTALVLPGGYIDILVDMSNLGEWMLHCHISEHLHAGMMMPFRVENTSEYATGDEFRATLGRNRNQLIGSNTTYQFSDAPTSPYSVVIDTPRVVVNKDTLMAFSFKDSLGNAVNLNDAAMTAIKVTFVKSDDSVRFITYPGNATFPAPIVPMQPMQGTMPASDGHNHIHFLGINTAYAHGDMADDGHHAGNMGRTYSVPVRFPDIGEYKGFVEFILEGETEPRVATISVTVTKASWSLDNYGFSPTAKWWLLLIISLVLMTPLSLLVRKYINKPVT